MGRRNKHRERAIAKERVQRLLSLAEVAALEGRQRDADRYAGLAWRLHERYLVPAPPQLRLHYCRPCGTYLHPGRTGRTRVRQGKLSTTCLSCGRVKRRPFRQEQRARRSGGGP